MHRHALLQYDNEDLCIHQRGVQEPRPHKQQAAQEVAVIAETHALAEKDAVVITPQDAHLAVVAVGAAGRSVCLTCVTVPVWKNRENIWIIEIHKHFKDITDQSEFKKQKLGWDKGDLS